MQDTIVSYRSSRDTMLVLPQPEEPTRAANLPFSICNTVSTIQFTGSELITVKLRPVKMGISLVGYLNHRSRNSMLTPPSVS
jgi:hypothetical protein